MMLELYHALVGFAIGAVVGMIIILFRSWLRR
jgi:hypothetical protein